MSQSASDRAVRKALLQAHAEVERIELARSIAVVREAVQPRSLLQRVLPFKLGGGGANRHSGSSPGLFSQIGSQVTTFYNRYPLLWSSVGSVLFRRTRFGRLFKLAGVALAVQRGLRGSRDVRRRSSR